MTEKESEYLQASRLSKLRDRTRKLYNGMHLFKALPEAPKTEAGRAVTLDSGSPKLSSERLFEQATLEEMNRDYEEFIKHKMDLTTLATDMPTSY